MNKFKRQLLATLATGAVMLNMVAPAFADTEVVVSGNGAYSNTSVNTTQNTTTTVVQNNTANVTNNVTANATSGGNNANQNTGGSVGISTGNATANATISNWLNQNEANVTCCASGNTTVNVTGNGAYSDQNITLNQTANNQIFQDNKAKVKSNVKTDANSGKNNANQNTGSDVLITTGDAEASANVSTTANLNKAQIGNGQGGGGSLSILVDGNGAYSNNTVNLKVKKDNLIKQDNWADIYNYVYAKANSGLNDANQNTGGSVGILTGSATAGVNIDNNVNFNWADVLCDVCFQDVLVKVKGNGYGSKNKVKESLNSSTQVFQDNWSNLYNKVKSKASSGDNDANQNTGPAGADPVFVHTGDASQWENITNSGNNNFYGGTPLEWPWSWPGDWNLNVTLNLGAFLSFLGLGA